MNDITTIVEDYSLPSKGQIYRIKFDPQVRLRSMTVAEEMKRLTATDSPYKAMSDIIEACLETKLPISVYDLCIGDYQYLLHKLRVVTYGPDYKVTAGCPYCGEIFEQQVNLDELKVNEYKPELDELKYLKLSSGATVELRYQTPRDLDRIETEKKNLKKQFPDMTDDPTYMLTLNSVIESVDGKPVTPVDVQTFIKKLPMRDSLLIMQTADKMNREVGIDITIKTTCPKCDSDVNAVFRYTGEFFRPEVIS